MKMALAPLNLTKVLYFDRPESEYGSALANEWSDYDLVMKNIRLGCKRNVEELLNFGCRINKPGKCGTPALSMAMRNGWTKVAKKMLDKGARVSDATCNVDSPLRYAFFKKKSVEMTSLINDMLERHLLYTKADYVHADGLSFFHIACAVGNIKYVEEFLDAGFIDVNCQVSNFAEKYAGYSALHFAVEFKRKDVMELLFKHKVNSYVQDVNGSTALHLAFYQQNWKAVNQLLSADREKKDIANDTGLTHFMIACTIENVMQAEQFLWRSRRSHGSYGPSILAFRRVKSRTIKLIHPYASCTPLHFAAMFGRLDTVKLLLSYNANCCATNSDWHKPAVLARKNNHLEICRVLRKHCEQQSYPVEMISNLSVKLNDCSIAINEDSGYDSMVSCNAC